VIKMGFIVSNSSNKPTKLSKTQKEALAKSKKVEKEVRKERQDRLLKAPAYVPPKLNIPDRNAGIKINSGPSHTPRVEDKPVEMSPEMIEREQKALEEKERMKGRTAPLYSKGPYQLIPDDPEIIKDLGKKV
jgi:hypothetical protein